MGCRPISSRLISIRLRAAPFNITIIQAYAPTTGHDDDEVEDFYDQIQEIIDEASKKDIIIVQGDWNAKIGEDAFTDWKDTCGPYCNSTTNERGYKLLDFARSNSLKVMNTYGAHKASRGDGLGTVLAAVTTTKSIISWFPKDSTQASTSPKLEASQGQTLEVTTT